MDFGMWRETLQQPPCQRTWERLFTLAYASASHPDFEHVWLPYALNILRGWPRGTRVADVAQTRILLEKPSPQVAALCLDGVTLIYEAQTTPMETLYPHVPIAKLQIYNLSHQNTATQACVSRTHTLRVHHTTPEAFLELFQDRHLGSLRALHLDAGTSTPGALTHLTTLKATRSLQKLYIGQCNQFSPVLRLLETLPSQLQSLRVRLDSDHNAHQILQELQRFTHLETLSLGWFNNYQSGFSKEVASPLLGTLTRHQKLRSLTLAGFHLTPQHLQDLSPLLARLEQLNLVESVPNMDTLHALSKAPSLTKLQLLNLRIEDQTRRAWLLELDWAHTLRNVRINTNDAVLNHHIATQQHPERYSTLVIGRDHPVVPDDPHELLNALAQHPCWPHVRELRLQGLQIPDTFAQDIARGHGPPNLKRLTLDSMQLSTRGWDTLATTPDIQVSGVPHQEIRRWHHNPGPTLHVHETVGYRLSEDLLRNPTPLRQLRELRFQSMCSTVHVIHELMRTPELENLERLYLPSSDLCVTLLEPLMDWSQRTGCTLHDAREEDILFQQLQGQGSRLDIDLLHLHHSTHALVSLLETSHHTHLRLFAHHGLSHDNQTRRIAQLIRCKTPVWDRLTKLDLWGNSVRLPEMLHAVQTPQPSLQHVSIRTGRALTPQHLRLERGDLRLPQWFRGLKTLEIEVIEEAREGLLGQLEGSGVEVYFL